jgi:hypothetical protein
MKALALLTACTLAALAGCQGSGRDKADEPGQAPARPGTGFSMPFEAAEDTEWAASTKTGAQRGTIAQGEVVMFKGEPDPSKAWQQGRIRDGTIRYVQPKSFRMSGR